MRINNDMSGVILILILIIVACGCGSKNVDSFAFRNADAQIDQKKLAGDHSLSGDASFYAHRFNGRKTASGELYDSQEMTAAHLTLPFGTIVRVVDTKTNRSVRVRINDRGPYAKKRVIDLSGEAARELKMIRRGVVHVEIIVLELPK